MSVNPIVDKIRLCKSRLESVQDDSSFRQVLNDMGELITVCTQQDPEVAILLRKAREELAGATDQAHVHGWEYWPKIAGQSYETLEHAQHCAEEHARKDDRTLH